MALQAKDATDTTNDGNQSMKPVANETGCSTAPRREHRVLCFHEAATLSDDYIVDNLEKLEAMHPSLGRSIIKNGFSSTLAQAAFGYRDWALHTVGVLAAMGGCADQTDVYLASALEATLRS